jgi:hypothetical protein
METINIKSNKEKFEEKLESRLRSTFRPIKPDPIFVKKLKKRLADKAEIYLEQGEPSVNIIFLFSSLLFIVAGMILLSRLFKK